MTARQDVDYFLSREAEERTRASASDHHAVRDAHFRLAERYADAVSSAGEALACPVRASGLWSRCDRPPE